MLLLAVTVALVVLLLPGELNAGARAHLQTTLNELGEQVNGAAKRNVSIVSVFGPRRHILYPAA